MFVTLVLLAVTWHTIQGANLLFLSPITSHSHTHFFYYTIKALAERGHTITHWNGLAPRDNTANVTHLHTTSLHKYNSRHQIGFDGNNIFKLTLGYPDRVVAACRASQSDPIFHRLMSSREKFDAVIVEGFMNDCMLPLAVHFNAPLIYMTALPPLPWMFDWGCSPMSSAQFPILGSAFGEEMNFLERALNTVFVSSAVIFRDWVVLPKADRVASKAWSKVNTSIPPIREIEKSKISMFLTNIQPIVHHQFFKTNAVVEVGGLHLVPPQPLPDDLKTFLEGSGDAGFIVLSFGTILKGSSIPESTRKIFVSAFSQLPQRVLWKWEEPAGMTDVPPNVRLSPWLPPLIDLLAHPRCRLLMTHGGLYSNQEAVYHGVPLIGFPVFGDQINYITKAQRDGYAIRLDWMTVTEESLLKAIRELINNPKYKERVMHLSELMQEQIAETRPLERAVRAIESVARHGGAQHMRPASCRLSVFQRELWDVYFILYGLFLMFCYIAWMLVQSSRIKISQWLRREQDTSLQNVKKSQ